VADLGLVLCPPYDVIDAADDRRLRERHPFNVVRLELTTASIAGGPDRRYEEAAGTLRSWRDQGVLLRDEAPSYYLHEASFVQAGGTMTRRELIAEVRLEPWDRRVVLPHERTYPRAKADRLRLLAATEANLSPILVFYDRNGAPDRSADHGAAGRQADAVDAAWAWMANRAPDAAGTDADGVGHRLWALGDLELGEALRTFFADRPLFIADGHHRYETALNYLEDRLKQAGGDLSASHPARFVMMHLIAEDDPGLVILPLHRLVKGVGAQELAKLVDRLRTDFEVETREAQTAGQLDAALTELRVGGEAGQSVALVSPEAAAIVHLKRPPGAAMPPGIPGDRDPAWQALDVVLVDFTIVQPVLAAGALHAEDAISYTRDAHDAVEQVRSGAADLAVLVNPTRVEQVAAVALAGERMPEKSTYFYPKAPTGLVLRPLK
jgi:uncharacterized protein (DUF1015 family)